MSRCQGPVQIAAIRHDPGLVERDPFFYAVVESAEHDVGVVGKPLRYLRIEPTPAIIERCGEVPMEERDERLDLILEQGIDKPLIEVQSGTIHGPGAGGKNPAPRNAEAVSLQSESSHQRDVFCPPAIVIAGDVSHISVAD